MGPWAKAFLDAMSAAHASETSGVTELRIDPSLISARVGGRQVTLSAPPIPPGIWAAVDGSVTPDRQTEQLAQLLDHTWDEPLVPPEIVRIGADADVAAVARAVAAAIEDEPASLLRWRGYHTDTAPAGDAWRGGPLPELPPPARRPPDSVPKRFGASGIVTPDGDLVEIVVRAYAAFGEADQRLG
jgi:hypothetical protein